ncbi:MAG: hypothetical protein A3F17_06475 [Gammaproteobacteria bacterium RIFCSPHIGHO2_12_FULL_41_15]|nr:MAG: hypothetical protein A3F17_06475 [Gammaproteobacteria bacterium RIFCSPHIGHO2_12_FULL_41_15]
MKKQIKIAALSLLLASTSGLALAKAQVNVQGFTLANATSAELTLDSSTPPAKGDQVPATISGSTVWTELNIASNNTAQADLLQYNLQNGGACLIRFGYMSGSPYIDSVTPVGANCSYSGNTITIANSH